MTGQPEGTGGGADAVDVRGEEVDGVSLARYAAVRAGVAEGFDLGAVLAREAVDPARWPAAERGWGERLAAEVDPTEGIGAAYDACLARAQARYGRRLPPIDEALRAWLDFKRGIEAADDPFALLARAGVTPLEVARLHGAWSRRLAEDAGLAEEARGILGAERGEVPVVRPERRVIDVPPAAARVAREEKEAARALPGPAVHPVEEARDVPPLFVPLPGWPDAEPALPPASLGTEAPADTLPAQPSPLARPALPFAPGGAAAAFVTEAPAPRLVVAADLGDAPPSDEPTTVTLPVLPSPVAAPLPFAPAAAAPPPAAPVPAPALVPAPAPAPPLPDLGGTVMGTVSPFAAPLPFAPKAPASLAPAPAPPRPTTPRDLGSTLPSGASPFSAAWPFAPKAAAPPPAAPPAAPPRVPADDDTTIQGPSPLRAPVPPTPAPAAGLSPAAARLTLAHHASLTAEIAVAPDTAAAVYQRYGIVAAAEREALDRAWQERLQRNPTEQREWQRLYAGYATYWQAQGQRRNAPPR